MTPRNAAASFVVMETVDQAQWVVDNLNGRLLAAKPYSIRLA